MLQSEQCRTADVHDKVNRLLRSTLGRFVKPVAIVASPDLSRVDYTAATSQLDDDDMDVGTACRQFIRDAQTATDEGEFMEREAAWDVSKETEKAFFGFVHYW